MARAKNETTLPDLESVATPEPLDLLQLVKIARAAYDAPIRREISGHMYSANGYRLGDTDVAVAVGDTGAPMIVTANPLKPADVAKKLRNEWADPVGNATAHSVEPVEVHYSYSAFVVSAMTPPAQDQQRRTAALEALRENGADAIVSGAVMMALGKG